MDPDVPLVVPEVNPAPARNRPKGIITNPNCTTLTMMDALGALHAGGGSRELVVSSYQAASGAGPARHRPAVRRARGRRRRPELGQRSRRRARAWSADKLGEDSPFPAPLALNVVPWAGSLKDGGWSSEELKVRNESRKILGIPDLKVSATCVRVPVDHDALAGRARRVRAGHHRRARRARRSWRHRAWWSSTTPARASSRPRPTSSGSDPTFVGRIRQALDFPNTLELFVCGDNLRKGAALNTAQIAELVARELTADADQG